MTYRLPSLNALRAFEAAARHLSFKTAAAENGVTAGAISQQVKKLENSLGVALFRRLPHGLLLTGEGEIYLPLVSKVFDDLTDATELIAPKINSRKFTVGICPKAQETLPENWPRHNDKLSLYVREMVLTSDVDLLHQGEIDCIIRLGGGPYGNLAVVRIDRVASEGHPAPELHYVCKPGLIDCRQSKALLDDLSTQTGQGDRIGSRAL